MVDIVFPDRDTVLSRLTPIRGPLPTRDMELVAGYLANTTKSITGAFTDTIRFLSRLDNPPSPLNDILTFNALELAAGIEQAHLVQQARSKVRVVDPDGLRF